MTTYDVKTGLNLGISGKRFEPNSTITERELTELCSEEAQEWLMEKGHVVKQPEEKTPRRKTKKTPAPDVSPAGSDDSEEK